MDKNSPEYKEAVREHAKTLGLDPDKEPQYLWIVEEALTAPVPDDWEQGETEDGTVYYFNVNTEESIWEHPMDSHYSELIKTKRAEDAKNSAESKQTAAALNSANKSTTPAPKNVAMVEEFDMDGDDEPKPMKKETGKANGNTKPSGFGKDSQSWLLDDEDDFPIQKTTSSKPSIVSSIKRQDDNVSKPTVVVSKPFTSTSTISPVPPTSFQTQPAQSTGVAPSNAATKELEKQIDSLKQEITQLKKEHEAMEKTERQAKTELRREIETLQRGKEQAEVEAKESNYLRMKVNELKSKISSLESKSDTSSDLYKTISELEKKLEAKTREVDEKKSEINNKSKEIAELNEKITQTQEEHERILQKKSDELNMKLKEHSIEIDDLKEQLLIRQATNINLQHSASDVDRIKKKCNDLEEELQLSKRQLADQTTSIAELRSALSEKERAFDFQLNAEVKKRNTLEQDIVAFKDRISELQTQLGDAEKLCQDQQRLAQDLETKLKTSKDDLAKTKSQLEDSTSKLRLLDELERSREEEKRLHEREIRAMQDKIQRANDDREDAEKIAKQQKEEHVRVQTKLQQEIEEFRRERERGHVQANEVGALKKEIDSLNIDIVRLRDQKSNADFEIRNLKQTMSLESSQALQLKAQVEEFTRKDFLEKQRYELLQNEKSAIEKKLLTLEAQIQTMRSEARTETDKHLFRIRELESLNARYEYDMTRADEKFSTAEKWRLKEVARVEQRDVEILEMKEELGRLKARNIEGENHHLINELRTSTKILENQVKELKSQLQEESSSKAQLERQFAQEAEYIKKQVHTQIPQLAAAATQRASDEWKRKCDELIGKLKSEFEENWLMERQKTSQREANWHDEKRELERQVKISLTEKDFLNKEISRLEDNNKHLMEQLHTIRVYLTQRPVQSAMAPTFYPPPMHPEVVGAQNLQNQLGILHAQFQQLFDHTIAPSIPPPPPQQHTTRNRFEQEPDVKPSFTSYKSNNAKHLNEKQELIRSMEELGGGVTRQEDWVPVVESNGNDSMWYKKGYWRSKYS